MHHKRTGPKSTRAGCLLCKPHKHQGALQKLRQRHSVSKAMISPAGYFDEGEQMHVRWRVDLRGEWTGIDQK